MSGVATAFDRERFMADLAERMEKRAARIPPVGSVVAAVCTCGHAAEHRQVGHPRYEVVDIKPGWSRIGATEAEKAVSGRARLRNLTTGRVHGTSMIRLLDHYVIESIPTEEVLLNA